MASLKTSAEWDFEELLDHPDRPLTKEQWNNFDRFLREPNDDKSAADVDIGPEVEKAIAEIERKKNYCW